VRRASTTEQKRGTVNWIYDYYELDGWTPATVIIDEGEGRRLGPYSAEVAYRRIHGCVAPRFTSEVVQQIAKDTTEGQCESFVVWADGAAQIHTPSADQPSRECPVDEDGIYTIGAMSWVWDEHATIDRDEAGLRLRALFRGKTLSLDLLALALPVLTATGLTVCRESALAAMTPPPAWPPCLVQIGDVPLRVWRILSGRTPDADLLRRVTEVLDQMDIDPDQAEADFALLP
jgi:hypothetical protein